MHSTTIKESQGLSVSEARILALASIVYYLVGFGIAFGDGGNGFFGGSGFVPSADSLLTVVPLDSASRFPERWAMLTPAASR